MEQEVNVSYYEIDGKNYLIGKKVNYNNSTYLLLINENDYTDSIIQKENGSELEPVENVEVLKKILELISINN